MKMAKTPAAGAVQAAMAEVAPAASTAEPETPNRDLILPKPTPELNPRNRVMAEIAARANVDADEAAKETVQAVDDEGNEVAAEAATEPSAPSNDTEGVEPQAEAASPAVEAPAPSGVDPEAEYEIEIEGQLTKVKGSQIIDAGRRTLQKETAADYRLQLATQAYNEAQRQLAAAKQPAQPAQPAPEPITDLQLAELVQFGTKEQAAAAIAEVRRRDPSALTTEGMQQFMSAQLPRIVDRQLEFREATRFVQNEYGDLLTDPYLRQLFFVEEDRLRKAGDQRGYTDLYKAIGDGIRKHFNRPKAPGSPVAPTASAAPAKTLEQRQAAKAAAPAAPRLASARLEGGATQQKPRSREEIIEQMRRSRGQDSLTRH
jgi:hypothetical protein